MEALLPVALLAACCGLPILVSWLSRATNRDDKRQGIDCCPPGFDREEAHAGHRADDTQ